MSDFDREAMEVDVVIVGAGPAGLSAAIRLKQLDEDLAVVVLEKGSEVGAHILSGAVLDPSGLDKLLPDWRDMGLPIETEVNDDRFYMLGEAGEIRLPNFAMPPLMNNHGNYIVSMGNVCRWMAEYAEGLGVEIYPGMSCSELVYGEIGRGDRCRGGRDGPGRGRHPRPGLRARHDHAGQIRAAGRGRAWLAVQDRHRQIRPVRRQANRRNTVSA